MTPWNRHRLLVLKHHREKPRHCHTWIRFFGDGGYGCSGCGARVTELMMQAAGSRLSMLELFLPVSDLSQLSMVNQLAPRY